MCKEYTPWEKCVEFHGHICPGLTLGFKSTLLALEKLGVTRAQDEELIAIVENDACGIDAVQVLTGCTIGKGNLIYKDYAKQVYTFASRKTGEAVRVAVKPGVMQRSPEHAALQAKIIKGEATAEDKKLYKAKHIELAQRIANLPAEEFAKVETVQIELPNKAQIFETVICSECGEGSAEPKIRLKNGKPVCLECAGPEYSRGW